MSERVKFFLFLSCAVALGVCSIVLVAYVSPRLNAIEARLLHLETRGR